MMRYSTDLNIAPHAEVLKLTVSHMCFSLDSQHSNWPGISAWSTDVKLWVTTVTEYFLWNYYDDDACALFSRKSQNCQGCSQCGVLWKMKPFCSAFRCASTLQCFVVHIHCSALYCIHAYAVLRLRCACTGELGVSRALGKVQSGLQSITRRKTSKMSLTHERNKDEQEITKKTKKFCILEEKSTCRCDFTCNM